MIIILLLLLFSISHYMFFNYRFSEGPRPKTKIPLFWGLCKPNQITEPVWNGFQPTYKTEGNNQQKKRAQ